MRLGRFVRCAFVHSSGSNEIDQPCKLAMYQWWFEPPRIVPAGPVPAR